MLQSCEGVQQQLSTVPRSLPPFALLSSSILSLSLEEEGQVGPSSACSLDLESNSWAGLPNRLIATSQGQWKGS